MDSYREIREVDYDPFAGEAEPQAAAPERKPDYIIPRIDPETIPKIEYEAEPEEKPVAPSYKEIREVDFDPFEQGSFVPEAGKAVAGGAVSTTGTMLKGAAGARQQDIITRRQEDARAKWLADNGYTGLTVIEDLPPEKQAEFRKALEETTTEAGPKLKDFTEDPFYKAGLATEEWGEEQFKAAHDYEGGWTRKIGEGFGSLAPFVAAHMVPGVGLATGVVAGGFASIGEGLDRAIKAGATPEQIMQVVKYAGIPGLTEQASVEALFSKIPMGAYGKVVQVIGQVAAKAMVEGGQEAAQQAMQNIIAKYVYKPDQEISEGVLEAAGIGAIVGGGVGAATPSTYKNDKEAKPPKVDDVPDRAAPTLPEGTPAATTPAVGEPTPGGLGEDPKQPAGVEAQPETPGPETVVPGTDPRTVAKPPTPQPVTPVTPGVSVVENGVAADIGVALAPSTQEESDEDFEEEPFVPGQEAEPEGEGQLEAIRKLRRERGVDQVIDKTLNAALQQQLPQSSTQQMPVQTPVIPPVSPAQAPAPPVQQAPAPPVQQAPIPENLGTGRALQAPAEPTAGTIAQPADVLPQLPASQVSAGANPLETPSTPVEQAPARPSTPAPAPAEMPTALAGYTEIREVDYDPFAGQAQTTAQPAAPAPAEPVQQRKPQSPHARALSDEVRLAVRARAAELGPDVVEHPALDEIIEEATSETVANLPAAERLSRKAVLARMEATAASIPQRVAARRAREAAEGEAKAIEQHETAEKLAFERREKSARTGKKSGKPAETVRGESIKATREAYKKNPEDPDLKTWKAAHEKRKKIHGKGEEAAKRREPLTRIMAEAQERRAARLEAEGKSVAAEKAAREEEKKAKPAPKPVVVPAGKTAQQVGEEQAEQQAMARRARTEQAVTQAFTDTKMPGTDIMTSKEKVKAHIRGYISSVKEALKKTGDTLSEARNKRHLTPQENLAVFGSELLHSNKHKDLDPDAFLTAQWLLDAGEIDLFHDMIGETSSRGGKYEVTDKTGAEPTGRVSTTNIEPSVRRGDTVQVTVKGKPVELQVERRTTAGKLLTRVTNQYRQGFHRWPGISGVLRRLHGKRLNQMVGDMDVVFMRPEEITKGGWKDGFRIKGAYVHKGTAGKAAGDPGFIIINTDMWEYLTPSERVDLVQHEMTHAATTFAFEANVRGTGEIIEKLRSTMHAQMKKAGGIPEEFEHAFSNGKEFITAAFTDYKFQQEMQRHEVPWEIRAGIKSLLKGKATPSWWDTFSATVANALGMARLSGSTSYFETALSVYPHVMQSTQRQLDLAKYAERFRNTDPEVTEKIFKRHRVELSRSPTPEGPLDIEPMLADVRDSLQASWENRADMRGFRLWDRAKRKVVMKAQTTRQLKRNYQDDLGGEGGAFSQIIDLLETRRHEKNEHAKNGEKLARELAVMNSSDTKRGTQVSSALFEASQGGYDPSVPLTDQANKHISKKGDKDYHRRLAHQKARQQWLAMDAEQQALGSGIINHFRTQEKKRVKLIVEAIVHEAVDTYGKKLPAGWDVNKVVDWVLNGGIDRPMLPGDPRLPEPNDRTPEDQELHEALGSVIDSLTNSRTMSNIQGVYVPFHREGSHIFSARHEVETPPGAVKDQATGDPVEDKLIDNFVFSNKKDLHAYIRANNAKPDGVRDQIDGKVRIEWRDSTGKKVHSKDADASKFYRVHVQNKVVEMSNDQKELRRLQRDYQKKGFTTTAIAERDAIVHQTNNVSSPALNRLIRSVQQSSKSQSVKDTIIHGMNEAHIRQLAGQRATHRRLKRRNIKGYSKDLVHSMMVNNSITAGQMANLQMAPQLGRAEKALSELLKTKQKNQYGADNAQFLTAQAAVKEVLSRFNAASNHRQDTKADRFVNAVTAMTAIMQLMTPSYHVINATGPQLGVAVAAPKFGMRNATMAFGRAYKRLGVARSYGKGLAETGSEFLSAIKDPILRAKDKGTYDDHLIRRMQGDPLQPLFIQGLDELNRRGLGAQGGTEAPELSELSMSAAEKAVYRASRVSRALGEAGESVNRSVTLLMNLDLAKQSGMSDEQALLHAVDSVERSQGGYAAENYSNVFNHPAARIPFQFTKYGFMYAQAYYGALSLTIGRDTDPAIRKEAAKQLGYMSMLSTVYAGTSGLALAEIGHAFVLVGGMLGLWDYEWEDFENWQQEMLQMILGKRFAEAIVRGLPRLVGIDVSSRMGNDSLVLFGDPESYAFKDILTYVAERAAGATGGNLKRMLDSWQEADSLDDALGILPLPKMVADVRKAVDKFNNGTRNKYGTQTGEPINLAEAIVQGLGFKPASEQRRHEPGGSEFKAREKTRIRHQRTDLMGEHYEEDAAGKVEVMKKIRQFNRENPKQRIDYSDLLRSKRKRKQDEKERRLEDAD
jgi:hypothetical protein